MSVGAYLGWLHKGVDLPLRLFYVLGLLLSISRGLAVYHWGSISVILRSDPKKRRSITAKG